MHRWMHVLCFFLKPVWEINQAAAHKLEGFIFTANSKNVVLTESSENLVIFNGCLNYFDDEFWNSKTSLMLGSKHGFNGHLMELQ